VVHPGAGRTNLARKGAAEPTQSVFPQPARHQGFLNGIGAALAAEDTAMTELDEAREARQLIARHLADLHRLHLTLAADSRRLKAFGNGGQAQAEIEIAAEMLEQYLAATGAFLENMRGRYEARLPLLRRGEPVGGELAPGQGPAGHGAFWYAFSRLCAVLRQVARRVS
jgi:hypothetical protein